MVQNNDIPEEVNDIERYTQDLYTQIEALNGASSIKTTVDEFDASNQELDELTPRDATISLLGYEVGGTATVDAILRFGERW